MPYGKLPFIKLQITSFLVNSVTQHTKRCDNRSSLTKTLRVVDIIDTSVDIKGLERLLSEFKSLQSIKLANSVWNSFFAHLSQDHSSLEIGDTKNEICLDCVGVCDNIVETNFDSTAWKYVSLISEIFPNLKHLTFNLSTLFRNETNIIDDVINSMKKFLPELKKQTSMTVISSNLDFDLIRPCISLDCGERLTEIVFVGNKSSVIDIARLDHMCPFLEILCISHASISFNGQTLPEIFQLQHSGTARCSKYAYDYF